MRGALIFAPMVIPIIADLCIPFSGDKALTTLPKIQKSRFRPRQRMRLLIIDDPRLVGIRALIPLSIANCLREKNTKQKPGKSCYIPCEGI
jgi:hypothetical protein